MTAPEPRATAAAWTAAAMLTLGAVARAGVGHAPFPFWDGDPFVQAQPLVAVGPTAFLALDLVGILGAALALLAAPRVSRAGVVLFAVGAAGMLAHIARSPEHAQPGSAWVGAVATGLGAWHLGRIAPIRRAMLGAGLGFAGMLAAKGALQFFVEHPQTIEHFEQTRDAFYEARGWTPGSRSALIYERRLNQPAATGWFGLANVYATFVGTAAVAFALAGLAALRDRARRAGALVLLAGALAAGAALAMTASKGAWAAAGLGLAVGAAAPVLARAAWTRAVPPVLTLGVPLAALAAVVARGMIGERIGELSVLFRWFYFEGAARVFADHPVLGVGPAGFKDAYVLRRPALSPEEVSSAHSVLVDWAATLGVFGLAWGVLFLVWAWHAGRADRTPGSEEASAPTDDRGARAFAVGVAVVVTAGSALVEQQAITPEGAAARAAGLLAWLALAWGVLRVSRAGGSLPIGAGVGAAAVILAHTQLDMAAVAEASAPLALLWLGTLIAPPGSAVRSGRRERGLWAAAVAGAGVTLGVLAGPAMWRWESALRRAAEPARLIAETRAQLETAPTASEAGLIAAGAAVALGVELRPARSVDAVYADTLRAAMDRAIVGLESAVRARPGHLGTRTSLTRVLLQRAGLAEGATRARLIDRAIATAEGGTVASPGSPSAWMWAGSVHAGLHEQGEGGAADAHLRAAVDRWTRAAGLDPHGLDAPVRLMRASVELGDPEAARDWGERALRADEGMRLDPLKRLSDGERAEAETAAGRSP